jgi:hypothetical protein
MNILFNGISIFLISKIQNVKKPKTAKNSVLKRQWLVYGSKSG